MTKKINRMGTESVTFSVMVTSNLLSMARNQDRSFHPFPRAKQFTHIKKKTEYIGMFLFRKYPIVIIRLAYVAIIFVVNKLSAYDNILLKK